MTRRRIGTVEAEARRFAAGLGDLTDRDRLQVAGLISLAKQVDASDSGSAAAAAAREMRMFLGTLRERTSIQLAPGAHRLASLADARQRKIEEAEGAGS